MPGVLLQRDVELAALRRQLDGVRASEGRVVVVQGPAGIGKSSLLAAVAATAVSQDVRALRAWGGPLEHDAAWGIARQLFAAVRGTSEWDELAVGAAALARRALDLDAAEPALAGDAMHAAVHGLTWLACNLAERSPTLLVVDDAHWADAPSLRWLVQLARQTAELRLGILCAVRVGEPPAHPDLLAELLAVAPEAPVHPSPLGPAAAEALVRRRLPAADRAFAHSCHAATAGNPFLLGALLSHLAAEHVEPTEEVGAALSSFGPEQISRAVERQLSRLPDGAQPLARAFAVLGRRAPLRHAGELAGLDPADAALLADRLHAAGLVESEAGAYALVHPLVAGALYRGLPAGERGLWHARAAAVLERERAGPEAVALHLLHTDPRGDAATVAVLRAAAAHAGLRGAPESAARFLRRALDEPPPERALEAEVRSELGLVLAAHLEPEAPALLGDAVELADAPARRAQIALSAARALGLAGHFAHAIELCRRGLEQTTGVGPELVARLDAELCCNAGCDAATVGELRERLRDVAQRPPPLDLWRFNAAFLAIADARPADEARAQLDAAFAASALDDDGDSLLGTLATVDLIANDELDAACAHCGALIDLAHPRGWRIALAHGSFLRAIALVRAGRIRAAEADARLAFDFKLAHSPPQALIWSVVPLVDALTELDAPAEADAVMAAGGFLGDPPDGALAGPLLLQGRGRLRLIQRRPAEAHADLRAAATRWDELSIRHPGLADWRVDDCEALVALGDVREARRLAEEHRTLAEQVGLPAPRAAGLRALAQTVERDRAIVLLERAVDLVADSQVQLEHARCLVALGAALRRANRRAAARDPLRRALELADRGGLRRLARRAGAELRAAGARPRRAALSGIEALTASEHRVATLAAHGRSNREIAQELYVTQRTVETHLTHVFQKLDIGSRAELACALEPRAAAAEAARAGSG
ncbi:MAG: AAA family ATPase [Solirubrobacterales bacterium]